MVSKIQFIIGDTDVGAPKLNVMLDMAFIDSDERTYIETFETVLELLWPNGFTLADDALWGGHVIDPYYRRDRRT